MRRAIEAGVTTIEHGDGGTPELFKMMKDKDIALCPTLAATEAYSVYFFGWKKGDPDNAQIRRKKYIFNEAMKAGVTICMGGVLLAECGTEYRCFVDSEAALGTLDGRQKGCQQG